jgi:hypothetical protein
MKKIIKYLISDETIFAPDASIKLIAESTHLDNIKIIIMFFLPFASTPSESAEKKPAIGALTLSS